MSDEKETVLLGMSPGNSYFSEAKIEQLLLWAREQDLEALVMIPDVPAVHTYRALNANRPVQKARLAGNALRNKCARIITQNSLNKVSILNWEEEISRTQKYNEEYSKIIHLFETSDDFYKDVNQTTCDVLEGKLPKDSELKQAIIIGRQFLLEELAGILATPEILGRSKITYIYHRPWPVFENLISGNYDGQYRDNITFKSVKFTDTAQ